MANTGQNTTGGGPTRAKPSARTGKDVALGVFKWIGIVAVSLAVIALGAFGVIYAATPVPDPNEDFQTNVTTVYYNDGTEELGSFVVQNRVSIPLSDMSQYAKDAIVASENESFWTDPGISIPGLMRALVSALDPNEVTIGGSTITQQYVKVLYLSQERTLSRKFTEIILALKIGQQQSKEEILEGYLNTVYFGRGTYGLQAASQAYFGVDASELNLPQAVALTAIINSPNNLDPARGEQQAADLLERYQYSLNQMVKLGMITQEERDAVYDNLPDFPKLVSDSRFGGPKGFLLKMVQDELSGAGFTDAQISGGGLQIITTVDADAQAAAVTAAQASTKRAATAARKDASSLHAAIASLDTETGAILAMYGGPDYTTDYRNWATTPRPTGSTFKPWALVAGLRDGVSLYDSFNGNSNFTLKGEKKSITNAGGTNYGPVTLLKATTSSINSAYVDMVSQMDDGPEKVIKAAQDAGIPNTNFDPVPAIPLGFGEISPVNAARGFATLVNGGYQVTPHIVAEVRDPSGQVLYEPVISNPQTIETDVARNATYALSTVVTSGTGRAVRGLGVDIAGKTGTYYDSDAKETRASWFVGATAQIATAVMFVSGDQGTGNLDEFSRGFYGAGYPATTWLSFMKVAQQGQPRVSFDGPTKQVSSGRFTAPPQPKVTAQPTTRATAEEENGRDEDDEDDRGSTWPGGSGSGDSGSGSNTGGSNSGGSNSGGGGSNSGGGSDSGADGGSGD